MTELSLEPTQFIKISESTVPNGAEAFFLPAPGGAKLRVAAFPIIPAKGSLSNSVKGTVVLLTGWSEFIEKYGETVEDLHARGFNVVMMDWRGQGMSSRLLPVREKGHIQSFGTHGADLKHFVQHFARPRFEGPFFLMAHSMGGTIALLALASGLSGFKGAVLCSPMTRIFPQTTKRLAVKMAARLGVLFGAGRASVPSGREHARCYEGNILTHDERRHRVFRKLLEAAPEASLLGPTFGWVKAATDATQFINKPGALSAIQTPVKMITAGDDLLVDGENTKHLAAHYPIMEFAEIPGAYHELLMECDEHRRLFWQHFDVFMEGLAI